MVNVKVIYVVVNSDFVKQSLIIVLLLMDVSTSLVNVMQLDVEKELVNVLKVNVVVKKDIVVLLLPFVPLH